MICFCRLPSPTRPVAAVRVVCAAIALLICASPALAQETREYAVIASPGVPAQDLSLSGLRRLFRFDQRYWNGTVRVNVMILEDDLVDTSLLLRKIYNMDGVALRRYILRRLYQGDIDRAPKVVASTEILLQFVASGQGVIALIPVSEIGNAKVRILTIDGFRPGDPGYVLRH